MHVTIKAYRPNRMGMYHKGRFELIPVRIDGDAFARYSVIRVRVSGRLVCDSRNLSLRATHVAGIICFWRSITACVYVCM